MDIILELFLVFFKIGLFSFGGGLGMIPLIIDEVTKRNWMSYEGVINFVGIAESTPGPIAVNIATLIGVEQAGILGGAVATLGVVLPSFIIILLIASVLTNLVKNKIFKAVFSGFKPVIVGLIIGMGFILLYNNVLIIDNNDFNSITFEFKSLIISIIIAILYLLYSKIFKKKMSPFILIIASAILGLLIYSF